MPYGAVTLIPGIDLEKTPTLNKSGVSQSQLIRYKDGLIQKYGGWKKYYPYALSGQPRDLHAWQDLNETNHLAVGTTTQLAIITNNQSVDITPQTLTTNPSPSFSTTLNSTTVQVTDPGVSNPTVYDSVLLNTPIAVGGIVLSGLYQITEVTGADSYDITAATPATSNITNGGAVPEFTTTSGSSIVKVTIAAHGLSAGGTVVFPISTTGNGVTIKGLYTVPPSGILDANDFNIIANNQASSSGSFNMNSGKAQIVYYINIGPPATGSGYGLGGYGDGGYGTGAGSGGQQTGTEITATDWTSDNFGEIGLFCPTGGGVYQYNPTAGFGNAGLVPTAPPFNTGMFISMQQEIVVCYGSTDTEDIGIQQDPLLMAWSDIGNLNFTQTATNQAGQQRMPTGSVIMTAGAFLNQDLVWTDLDLWAMNYIGFPDTFGFNKIGAGCGAVSSHAATGLRGNVYWMGQKNFFQFTSNGPAVIPCPVWDFVFQNLNSTYQANVRAMPNTPFNEAGWFFPSNNSSNGECDCYVKFNVTEPNAPWDFGPSGSLQRSAWTDQSILGPPISANQSGIVYFQETTNDADGSALNASFTTGYFFISEGEEYSFVDQILPDFIWGTYGASPTATIQLTFSVTNFPGDTPNIYGPYSVTQSTEILSVRFRGRQMSITVQSSDLGSFWRIGRLRYRYAPSGRR